MQREIIAQLILSHWSADDFLTDFCSFFFQSLIKIYIKKKIPYALGLQIYFNLSCCLNGYMPNKNDIVMATLIESSQRKKDWRVISIYPLSSGSNAYRLVLLFHFSFSNQLIIHIWSKLVGMISCFIFSN